MLLEFDWLEGRERYIQRLADGELIWNYHKRGFFLRPHGSLPDLIVCVQPADVVFRRSLDGGSINDISGILQQLSDGLPQDRLMSIYNDSELSHVYGIGPCDTGDRELVLAFRAKKETHIKPLWDIAEEGIDNFWSNYRPDLYSQSA